MGRLSPGGLLMRYEVEIKRAASKWQWLVGGIVGGAVLAIIAGKILSRW